MFDQYMSSQLAARIKDRLDSGYPLVSLKTIVLFIGALDVALTLIAMK